MKKLILEHNGSLTKGKTAFYGLSSLENSFILSRPVTIGRDPLENFVCSPKSMANVELRIFKKSGEWVVENLQNNLNPYLLKKNNNNFVPLRLKANDEKWIVPLSDGDVLSPSGFPVDIKKGIKIKFV